MTDQPKQKSMLLPGILIGAVITLVVVGILLVITIGTPLFVLSSAANRDTGTIVVTSNPTDDAEIILDGQPIGRRTPLTKSDVLPGEHILLARSVGYPDKAYRFELVPGQPVVIHVEFDDGGEMTRAGEKHRRARVGEVRPIPVPATVSAPNTDRVSAPERVDEPEAPATSCASTGGLLSIMPIGETDCTVTVGDAQLGRAPFFKKDCPIGTCRVVVTCPKGKRYETTRRIEHGANVKIIIRADDWR